jgi:UPF0755 protein
VSSRALLITLAGLTAVLALAAVVAIAGVRWALAPILEAAPEVTFQVQSGASLGRIAGDLEARGLIRSALAFKWLARYQDKAAQLQVGEYRLSSALTPEEILTRIVEGKVATYEVTIPEGWTAAQIALRLEEVGITQAADFSAVADDPASAAALGVEGATLEGYLFPETYYLPRGLSARDIAQILVNQFLDAWHEVEPKAREQKLSMREVVTLASIIEKETATPSERPLIASVFRNRLNKRMPLATDPTVIYGIPDFDGNLRKRDLENADNPYNTYRIRGLPPGPISNPGADALHAAVNPAESDYLFFVSNNDGSHIFSKTFREHDRAVSKYQRRRSK